MLQNESMVSIIDNSGAKTGIVIRVLKGSNARFASVGDFVVVAIKDSVPGGQVGKGEVSRAIIVRTRKEIGRSDGTYIRFGDNAVVLVDKDNEPKGKRIFGPVARELRDRGYKNIANLAEEII